MIIEQTRDYVEIKLSTTEILFAAQVGLMRQVQNIQRKRKPAHGAEKSRDWQYHIEGAIGEYVVAKALDMTWSGNIGNMKAADVGKLQVRTRSNHDWDLVVRDSDSDGDIFVLVTGQNGEYRVQGWLLGASGKRKEFLKSYAGREPQYFVPQSELWPLETLDVAPFRRRL